MIMQGQTSRSLSWAGALAVCGLAMLLPLAPIQAQSQPKQPAGAATPAKESRDELIETLKKAIAILEEQKKTGASNQQHRVIELKGDVLHGEDIKEKGDLIFHKEKGDLIFHLDKGGLDKKIIELKGAILHGMDKEEIGKRVAKELGEEIKIEIHNKTNAGDDLAALAKAIEAKRSELAALEAKYKALTTKMHQGKLEEALQVRQRALRALVEVQHAKDAKDAKDGKPASIDDKIERILKDVEELRREIQREKSQKATPPAGGKSMLLPGSPAPSGVKVIVTEEAAQPAGKRIILNKEADKKIDVINEPGTAGLRIRIADPNSPEKKDNEAKEPTKAKQEKKE